MSSYVERVELLFLVNGIEEGTHFSYLSRYGTLRNLLAPANPKDKYFADIFAALKGHFEPLIIAERFHFHR